MDLKKENDVTKDQFVALWGILIPQISLAKGNLLTQQLCNLAVAI